MKMKPATDISMKGIKTRLPADSEHSMSMYVNRESFYKERIRELEHQTIHLSYRRDVWKYFAAISAFAAILGWFIVLSVMFGGYL
jgi:hypothetical protein